MRVQRVLPDPRPRPQVRRPPRIRDPPDGGRTARAPRRGRDRRPPAAEERRRRGPGHRCLCPHQPGLHRRVRHRPRRTRHAPTRRDLRSDRRGPGLGARPGASLAGGGGARPGLRRAGRIHPDRHGADERPAAGRLGVPHQARTADVVATLGDRGRDQGRDRRPPRARFRQPLHARQGRGHRGDPRLASVRLRHRSHGPCHARRSAEAPPHDRARAEPDRHHDPHALCGPEGQAGPPAGPARRRRVRGGAAVQRSGPRRATGCSGRGTRGGSRARARAGVAAAGRPAVRAASHW